MPPLISGWTDIDNRTLQTNMRLGAVLAFVAGAANAGGGFWQSGPTPRT